MTLRTHLDRDRDGKTPSLRQSWCDVEQRLRNGSLQLRDALRGRRVSVIIQPEANSSWSYEFEEPSGGTPLPAERTYVGGFQLELLDELSKRAGFDWRGNFVASGGLVEGESWTTYASYWLDRYDLAINWFVETSYRKRHKLDYPYNWFDSSIILFTKITEDEPSLIDRFFSFRTPFSPGLWLVVLVSLLLSAVVYWLIEGQETNGDFGTTRNATLPRAGILQGLYLVAGQLTAALNFGPVSAFGKLFTISWAFVVLLLVSAYTANLASYLVVKKTESMEISSIEEAVELKLPICCLAETELICRTVQSMYPTAIIVGTSDWKSTMSLVRDGTCKAGISTASVWELNQVSLANKACDLRWVGRAVKNGQAGWLSRADHAHTDCTQILAEAISFHMLEMEEEGVIDEMWKARLKKETTNNCTMAKAAEPSAEDGRLTSDHMAGLFLVHAVFSFISLAGHYAYRGARKVKQHAAKGLPLSEMMPQMSSSAMTTMSSLSSFSSRLPLKPLASMGSFRPKRQETIEEPQEEELPSPVEVAPVEAAPEPPELGKALEPPLDLGELEKAGIADELQGVVEMVSALQREVQLLKARERVTPTGNELSEAKKRFGSPSPSRSRPKRARSRDRDIEMLC